MKYFAGTCELSGITYIYVIMLRVKKTVLHWPGPEPRLLSQIEFKPG